MNFREQGEITIIWFSDETQQLIMNDIHNNKYYYKLVIGLWDFNALFLDLLRRMMITLLSTSLSPLVNIERRISDSKLFLLSLLLDSTILINNFNNSL